MSIYSVFAFAAT